MQHKRLALSSAFALAILLVSLVSPATALADEATPPPTETAPVSVEATPTGVPTEEPTDPAPQDTQPTPTPTDPPTDAPGDQAAPAEPPPGVDEVLASVPEDTTVVALDAQGETVPLASVEAAQIITNGDPMWCPAGVLPGGAGCSASFNTFTGAGGLLASLASGPYAGNGVIYVANNYNSSLESGDITIDGSILTALYNLTFQGGWDFGLNAISGASLFDGVALNITNWNYAVSVNDIEIQNADTPTNGLTVRTTGDIALSNINSHDNWHGARLLSDGGNITITNASFSGNTFGLSASTRGNTTLNNVTVNDNWGGAHLFSDGGNITITNASFNNNYGGLTIYSSGDITLDDISADNNSATGAFIQWYSTGSSGDVTITDSSFSGNDGDGLQAYNNTAGTITLNNVTADGNDDNGVWLYTYGTGTDNITDSSFSGNGESGLYIHSSGDITLDGVNASDNGFFGADLFALGPISVINSSFNNCDGCNQIVGGAFQSRYGPINIQDSQFVGNEYAGLLAYSGGNVTLRNVTANHNGVLGAGGSSSNVTVCGGSYSYNGDFGLAGTTDGTVSISPGVVFDGNGIAPTHITAANVIENYNCDGNPKKTGDHKVVNVSDGQGVEIDCEDGLAGVELRLPNGDSLIVPCPMRGKASLSSLGVGQLPAGLPEGFSFVSALQAEAARDSLTVSFALPAPGSNYTILAWNGSSWVELDGATTVDGMFGVSPVSPGIYVLATK